MAYQSWSVVFGEQPSASKWGILGTNDASFNDGTGIFGLKKDLLTTDSNPYKFHVYRAGALTIGAGSTAKVTFETETFDTNNNFDATTNNRYVAPVNGFYWFSATVSMAVNANLYGILLYKNNSSHKRGNFYSTGAVATNNEFTVTTLLQLSATDYIEIYMFNNSGSGSAIDTGAEKSYFSGFLVCRT
jgi:hypothetical protein